MVRMLTLDRLKLLRNFINHPSTMWKLHLYLPEEDETLILMYTQETHYKPSKTVVEVFCHCHKSICRCCFSKDRKM